MTKAASRVQRRCLFRVQVVHAGGLGAVDDQGQRDLAAFAHQDVVGAAGGLAVHAFDADAARRQAGDQARMDEALALAGAEDDHVRARPRRSARSGRRVRSSKRATCQGAARVSGITIRL